MSELSNDRSPEFINDQQARDFSNRVLRGVANRLTGNEEWDLVNLDRTFRTGEIDKNVFFHAEYDDDWGVHLYNIGLGYTQPFDDQWRPEAIKKLLYLPENSEDTDFRIYQSDEESVFTGYVRSLHVYEFRIPFLRGSVPEYTKSMAYIVLDEDLDEVEDKCSYCEHEFDGHDACVDDDSLQRLIENGETVLDTHRYEEELRQVTIDDLEFILGSLQSIGLVRKNCQALSSRVR